MAERSATFSMISRDTDRSVWIFDIYQSPEPQDTAAKLQSSRALSTYIPSYI